MIEGFTCPLCLFFASDRLYFKPIFCLRVFKALFVLVYLVGM